MSETQIRGNTHVQTPKLDIYNWLVISVGLISHHIETG